MRSVSRSVTLHTHRRDDVSRISLSDDDAAKMFADDPKPKEDTMHHCRAVMTGPHISLYVDGALISCIWGQPRPVGRGR